MNMKQTPQRSPVHPMVRQDEVETYATMNNEFVMTHFIAMSAESLDPETYETVLDICKTLCSVRSRSLREDSVDRCTAAAFEYLESRKITG